MQWIHYESLHLLLGMEIRQPISKSFPPQKKNQRELGCDELAFEMDDYFPLLNLDLFSW